MRKPILSLVAVLILSVTLGACGGGEKGTPSAETPGARPPTGPVSIDFWHSEVGSNVETLNRLVDRFNASQNEVKVNCVLPGRLQRGRGQVDRVSWLGAGPGRGSVEREPDSENDRQRCRRSRPEVHRRGGL